ncbi:hypothetical protein IV54_GL001888 [Levilactobacillus paucivorans]|uniref:HTH cro/C1-type domain-containing protein n=1 Tax=Levilactobacillus paucivorans TaxID=616990 RepID=A0A0R2LQH0_9LACO|nr:helix-turn-helix domain-containing protein [Levilactobacillus paucivorans]KRO03908.1 hypothetical protein IV54_GL001888 [Levilactobacillus paucivorans]
MDLGKILKSARHNRGLTRPEAARSLAVSPLTVTLWEINLVMPTPAMIQRLATVYKFNVTTLQAFMAQAQRPQLEKTSNRLIRNGTVIGISLFLLTVHLAWFLKVLAIVSMLGIILYPFLSKPAAHSASQIKSTLIGVVIILILIPTFWGAPSLDSWGFLIAESVFFALYKTWHLMRGVGRKHQY